MSRHTPPESSPAARKAANIAVVATSAAILAATAMMRSCERGDAQAASGNESIVDSAVRALNRASRPPAPNP